MRYFETSRLHQNIYRSTLSISMNTGKKIVAGSKRWIATYSKKYLSDKNRLIIISMFVGVVAGLAAVLLKNFAHLIHRLIRPEWDSFHSVLYFVYPLVGLLLTVLFFKTILRRKLGKSLSDIIYSIEQKASRVDFSKTFSYVIGGGLTVGFGGSTGLEAPIAVTGSAIGSNIGRFFKFGYKERTVLLASGASAGIAAIFNSPIAGVLFSIETLLPNFSIPTIIPLLVATACASVISKLLYEEQLFYFISSGWLVDSIPFYILFGIGMGVLSAWFTKVVISIKKYFELKRRPFKKAVIGGGLLGAMVFLLPPLYGEGYETIKTILNGQYDRILELNWLFPNWFGEYHSVWMVILACVILIAIKPIATAVTIGAGGVGGVFAPSLFVGALAGLAFSLLVNQLGIVQLPIVNFVVAGMAAMLSGALHAPLMAIFLIAEITGGYSLFVPLMIVSALAFFVSKFFQSHNVYTYRLAKKGLLIGQNTDKFVLQHLKLSSLIDTDFSTVDPNMTLRELVDVVAHSSRNVFPVIGDEQQFKGVIVLDDLREVMFHPEQYDTILAKDIMKDPPTILKHSENVEKVMSKFDAHNAWHLPVVHYGRYLGMVSKKTVFSAYREYLVASLKSV
jgi:CIC family chloride channel protein